ncbi:MAG: type II toxin-antitoxin system VapC family toxin [Chloroflexota bacterium]|nr:type II toxin-antitoxin system VapC family toxin [Chloroflexota bacterium]
MIVPDLNLLIYAHNEAEPRHVPARRWWEDLVNGTERVGVPWVVTTGFVRLLTQRGVRADPATPEQVLDYVQEWFSFPHVVPLNPGVEHLTLIRRALAATGAGGNLVTDAHIAALAIEYQAEVHSNDADFARFPGLRWRNPL